MYRWTVIRNIPQLQKLDNVAVTSEEMAEAMRRGLDLEHPLDGGSSNQSAMLQTGGSHQQMPSPAPQEDERRRGGNRNSFHEQDQQQEHSYPHNQGRKESVQVSSNNYCSNIQIVWLVACCLKRNIQILCHSTISFQSPSRRVSNAVWPDTERQAANQSQVRSQHSCSLIGQSVQNILAMYKHAIILLHFTIARFLFTPPAPVACLISGH